MCKLSESAASVREAARELRKAIEGPAPADVTARTLNAAYPLELGIPEDQRAQLRRMP